MKTTVFRFEASRLTFGGRRDRTCAVAELEEPGRDPSPRAAVGAVPGPDLQGPARSPAGPLPRGLGAFLTACLFAAGLAPPCPAAEAPELSTLFPKQAEIFVDGQGLARLELGPEVVRELRSDFSDLRILDGEGREVAYLLDAGLPRKARGEVRLTVRARVLEVRRSIEEPEGAPQIHRESYEIAVPAKAPETGHWDLVFSTSRRSFVRQVRVTSDAEDAPLVSESSVFRLPDPLREKTRLALPGLAAGTTRLTIDLQGDEGRYLDPALRFESSRSFDPRERAAVELREIRRQGIDGETVIEVERPQGLVPDRLLLRTQSTAFRRPVEVWDEGPGSDDDALGAATVFRIEAFGKVESMEVPLRRPRGDRLRVILADGDSPPLEDLAVLAVVRRPALIFALPKSPSVDAAGTLLFGGARAYRPQYDLAPLLPALGRTVEGTAAQVAERLVDPQRLHRARLGAVLDNPSFDASPILAFAQRPGAALDAAAYRYRRTLAATPSSEGLVRLRLGIEDLHRARSDLADVRIVDPENRQWAYLLERSGALEARALAVDAVETRDGETTYSLSLPVASVELSRLTLELPEPYFDRAYRLEGMLGEGEVPLARGRLRRRIGDPRPVLLTFPARRVDHLELTVEDGDDAPLSLTSVGARLPVADLYFAAPAGEYSLLLGAPEARVPRYELARVRNVVLAVASGSAQAGPLEENPAFSSWRRWGSGRGAQQVLLWVALGLAIVGLSWMTLKLARKEAGTADTSES